MASAVRRSLQNQHAQASRLWSFIVSNEVCRRPITTSSTSLQDQQPIGVAVEKPMEAESIEMPTPNDRTKLLVLGGNGYVGSHVCKEAVERGLPVLSLNRSGKPSVQEAWVNDVNWIRGSLFQTQTWQDQLSEVTAVISCVGGFGSNDQMRKINGDANIFAINASAEAGVERFVFISAANFNLPFVLKGYYEGKVWLTKASTRELVVVQRRMSWVTPLEWLGGYIIVSYGGIIFVDKHLMRLWMKIAASCRRGIEVKVPLWRWLVCPGHVMPADNITIAYSYFTTASYGSKLASHEHPGLPFDGVFAGVILRPGFIHGTRRVGSMNLPLSVIGSPLETLFRSIKPASQLPVIGPLLIPPVKVTTVAKAAVRAAVDNAVPPGALDVWGIIRLGDHK